MMSSQHLCRSLYRHLLFDQNFTLSPSSSTQESERGFSCSYIPTPIATNTIDCPNIHNKNTGVTNNYSSTINQYTDMDILGITGYYNNLFPSTQGLANLHESCKEKSSTSESVNKMSAATTLFSPLSALISVAEAANAIATSSSAMSSSIPSSPSITPSASLLSELTQPSHFVPYYASCFSPLDLPSEVFVYLLEFLSPADLWRLCQVSHTMQLKVIGFMSKIQLFKYGAIRILHQENSDAVPELTQRAHTFYEHMTFGASSSSSLRMSFLLQPKNTGHVQTRSSYWLAQARYLVATITEGTSYEPRLENLPPAKGACTQVDRGTAAQRQSHLSEDFSAATSSSSTEAQSSSPSSPSPLTLAATAAAATSSTASGYLYTEPSRPTTHTPSVSTDSQELQPRKQGPMPDSLPLDRFNAMVELIFDPNIVQLSHRRAVINCARYVSASMDESFSKAAVTYDPVDLLFHEKFCEQHTVRTGPNLAVFSPILYDETGLKLSPKEQVLAGSKKSTTITPPTRLHNYFQVMLWHRCISDLITLYNRIQSRHVEAFQMHGQQVNTMTGCDEQSVKAVCCQDPPLREKEPSSSPTRPRTPEPYPFCCKAHSLVFTTQYPLSFVPYSLRVQFRRMVHKVQSVSQKKIWSSVSGWREQLGLAGRTIQYTGSTEKLQFCTGTAYPPSPPSAAASEGQLMAEEEALVQRRYRIEEQARQDNLDKQELLALCHMACGLFLADDRLQSPPPTIISLLRQGSPWNKGVWCEGEWQHASIDVRQPGQASLNGSSQSAANSSSVTEGDKSIESGQANDNGNDMGRWQSICIAAIQFLAHEDLAWGGNRTNAELSRLRAANNPSAWTYHE